MDLYLIRHADAVALDENGITEDADRPLSAKGEKQAEAVAKGLQRRGVVLDKLVTSPLVRARQTADIIMHHWNGTAPEVVETDLLVPDAKARKLTKFLMKLSGDRIGLVGHLPHIAEFAAQLIGSKKTQLDFAKAGVALITCGNAPGKGMGTLQWLVTPAWLEG